MPPVKVAFIDIGTNSIRYLAVSISPSDKFSILKLGLTAPRLGEGISGSGMLRKEAMSRALKTLQNIKTTLEASGVMVFECAGTEALRKAGNAREFTAAAEKMGLKIKILSGKQEAELVYLGAAGELKSQGGKMMLADVGGGSTEIITANRKDKKTELLSLPLGCVRLKEQFVTPAKMKNHSLNLLRKKWPKPPRNVSLVGLGGTFTTLAAIHLELPVYRGEKVHGLKLSRKEIDTIFRRLQSLPLKRREEVIGLPRQRADIMIPGTIIIRALLEHTGAEEVTVSDRGFLFGLLRKFLSRLNFSAGKI